MKNLLLTLIVIASFTACTNTQKEETLTRDIQLLSDSAVYTNSNIYTDHMNELQPEPAEEAVATPRLNTQKKAVVKTPRAKAKTQAPVYSPNETYEAAPPVVVTPPIVSAPETNTGTVESTGNTGDSGNETAGTIPQVEKKKGWNKATQGAVIGGVTGAVGGAIISKKKGLGAVIGGVAGAAGGYILGKKMDKKDHQFVIK